MQICKRVAGGRTPVSPDCSQPGKQGGSQAGHWSGLLKVCPALLWTPDPSMWHSGHLGDVCKPSKPSSTLTSVCFVHHSAMVLWPILGSSWAAPSRDSALPRLLSPWDLSLPLLVCIEWLKAKTLTLCTGLLPSPLSPLAAGGPRATYSSSLCPVSSCG